MKRSLLPLGRLAYQGLGGVLLGEGANTVYRASHGEDLPWQARLGTYLGGGLALRGNMGRGLQRAGRAAILPSAASKYIEREQKKNFGASLLDPKSVQEKMRSEIDAAAAGKPSEWISDLVPQRIKDWRPFQGSVDNSAQNAELIASARQRANEYLRRYGGR